MTEEKPRLEPASDGYQVFYRNRRLYTPHGPRAGAVRRATAARPDPGTLILAASPLLGYGIAELLDAAPADTVVLAVEFDSSLAELTRRAAEEEFGHLAEQDPRLLLLLAPSAEELEETVQRLLRRRPRRTRLVTLSGGFGLHAERYRALQSHIDREIRIYWQNTMTRVRMGRLWIRNVLRNLPLVPTATPTETLYRRVPTVVVGAGPSLDEKVALLPPDGHPRRRHLRILAVDTAAAPLAARGVTPDLVLAVESQQANAADFLGTPLSRPDCPTQLICDLSAYPGSTHAVAPERLSFVSSRFASTILLDRLDESRVRPMPVPPLGSVGVLAVHLARRLGGEPVYLMGLDFAYDIERTHARGAPMHTLTLLRRTRTYPSPFFDLALSRPLIRQEDKRGRSVRTDTVLLSYAEQLQSVVREAGAVYDLSPDHGL
ncbi:MAG: 6-hydroxymethylpterin diphosphokinase MptE-like protein, partial [Spirochaetaceae bacterium]